jgi:hypothetical protein
MATKRLGIWEKSTIKSSIESQLSCLKYSATFPYGLEHEDIKELLGHTADPDLRALVSQLQAHPDGSVLIDNHWYVSPSITYRGEEYTLEVSYQYPAYKQMSFNRSTCDPDVYNKIGEFCEAQWELTQAGSRTSAFLSEIIDDSHSAGQVLRVIPWITDYLGYEAKESLAGAVRKSRLPRPIKDRIDDDPRAWREKVEKASNTMALAHIANSEIPDNRRKISVKKKTG